MVVLTNKQYRNYSYISRYASFPFYYNKNDKKYIYGTTTNLDDNTLYQLHKVRQNETLDSLALDYYNNPTFFWVIADFNRIQDPYKKLIVDTEIKIPALSSISFKG